MSLDVCISSRGKIQEADDMQFCYLRTTNREKVEFQQSKQSCGSKSKCLLISYICFWDRVERMHQDDDMGGELYSALPWVNTRQPTLM